MRGSMSLGFISDTRSKKERGAVEVKRRRWLGLRRDRDSE